MKYLSSEQLKDELLKMMKWLDYFCKENDIIYSLAYGTLIGAVRHRDFIPWDDDLDIVMLREDYEKLLLLAPKVREGTGYALLSWEDNSCEYPFAKLVNTRIIANQELIENKNNYLWIDIFPLDFVPDDVNKRRLLYKKARRFRTMLEIMKCSITKNERGITFKHRIKAAVKPALRIFGLSYCLKRTCSLAKESNIENYNSGLIANIVWGYGESGTITVDDYLPMEEMEFRGERFMVMACWDAFLKQSYGDYMKIPDKSKRVCHGVKAYYKST